MKFQIPTSASATSYVHEIFTYGKIAVDARPASIVGSRGVLECIQPNPERKMNGGDDASANGANGGGEDAAMVVVDQPPTAPDLLSAAAASNNGGGSNEEAEAVEDEEMAEQQGENGNGSNAGSSSSRYSLRKRSRQPLLSIQDNSKPTGPNSKTSRGGNKKKQQPPSSYETNAFGYVDTSTLTDRQFERLLAHYEEDGARKREQKKQRLERGYADDDYPYIAPAEGYRPAFDDLPKEAITRVFECLPTVRAVFNLAYQSKYMMSFVEERVSSGVVGGLLIMCGAGGILYNSMHGGSLLSAIPNAIVLDFYRNVLWRRIGWRAVTGK